MPLPAKTDDFAVSSSFPEYYAHDYPQLSAGEKRAFIAAFGGFIGRLHAQGVPTWKYPAARIRVAARDASWTFGHAGLTADAHSGQALSASLRRKGLSALYAEFLTTSRRAERLRFYQAYRHDGGKLSGQHADLVKLDRAAIALARRTWHRRDQAVRRNNEQFAVERRGPFKIHRLRCPETESLLTHLLPDPDRLFAIGESFSRRGIGSDSVRVEIAGRPYFLKRYAGRGWEYQLKSVFRRSRAFRVWLTNWGFGNRGLPVPRTLLLLEERRYRFLKRAYLVTDFQDGAACLVDAWPGLTANEQRHLLARSAILLGRMHSFGCIHGDTNWENILIRRAAGDNRLLLVDLDCGRVTRFLTGRRARRDVWHFERDLLRPQIGGAAYRSFFLRIWRRWFTNR